MNCKEEKVASRAVAWIPNGVTSLSIICGFLAIVLSEDPMKEFCCGLKNLEICWILIGAAAVFDFLDGLVARLLHATSAMGKELDSLCDLVSFGVAPSVMLFQTLKSLCPMWCLSWLSVAICVFGALRLAKFNVDTRQTTSFIGLPIPANAIFWIGFMAMLTYRGIQSEIVVGIIILAVSLLMVSGLPMFSFKLKGPMKIDRDNICRIILIISAILFVVFLGVEGLMWTIVMYVLLSVVNRLSECIVKK